MLRLFYNWAQRTIVSDIQQHLWPQGLGTAKTELEYGDLTGSLNCCSAVIITHALDTLLSEVCSGVSGRDPDGLPIGPAPKLCPVGKASRMFQEGCLSPPTAAKPSTNTAHPAHDHQHRTFRSFRHYTHSFHRAFQLAGLIYGGVDTARYGHAWRALGPTGLIRRRLLLVLFFFLF